jgi:ankyrin repeat protein
LLVEKGGSSVVNAQNCYGATALHYAADTGREDIVDLLLSNGANPELTQDLGKTPWKLADDKRLDQADLEANRLTPIVSKLKVALAPSNNVDNSKLLRSRYDCRGSAELLLHRADAIQITYEQEDLQ